MAKKSFQDYFILFFMVVAFTFQIIWLSILCTVNCKRWNVDSSQKIDGQRETGDRKKYGCPGEEFKKPDDFINYKDFIGNIDKIIIGVSK